MEAVADLVTTVHSRDPDMEGLGIRGEGFGPSDRRNRLGESVPAIFGLAPGRDYVHPVCARPFHPTAFFQTVTTISGVLLGASNQEKRKGLSEDVPDDEKKGGGVFSRPIENTRNTLMH